MSLFLKPLELAYRAVAGTTRRLYRAGVLKRKRLPRPVISIGNIAFGGSGKTPVTITVAEELVGHGLRVAVLSRGYRRATRDCAIVDTLDPDGFGDEPVVIAQRLEGQPVVVGIDRHAAGTYFLERGDCDVFLLDDGFQHLRLARDLDVVIDDPGAQLLRESRSALRDADVILARGAAAAGAEFRLTIEPTAVVTGGRVEPVEVLRGRLAVIFCGLAHNERFFTTCREVGVDVAATRAFPDHHRYTKSDLEHLRSVAAATRAMLLTTEKDAVKIRADDVSFLRVQARIEPRLRFLALIESAARGAAR